MASKRQKKKQAFQSTLPVWGGTWCFLSGLIFYLYFNPPSPCGEGLLNPVNMCSFVAISIHPPRVGRDGGIWGTTETTIPISIHPPRVGRDSGSGEAPAGPAGISIHPPRVGRDPFFLEQSSIPIISIHPPRVGRDHQGDMHLIIKLLISIHPPRVGRDSMITWIASG